jgi:hypothetical protein
MITRFEEKLRYKYHITEKQYDEINMIQDGVCAICGGEELNKMLSVDHNHITNNVRGLLCTKCNLGLGCFKDDISTLESAIKYLKEHDD